MADERIGGSPLGGSKLVVGSLSKVTAIATIGSSTELAFDLVLLIWGYMTKLEQFFLRRLAIRLADDRRTLLYDGARAVRTRVAIPESKICTKTACSGRIGNKICGLNEKAYICPDDNPSTMEVTKSLAVVRNQQLVGDLFSRQSHYEWRRFHQLSFIVETRRSLRWRSRGDPPRMNGDRDQYCGSVDTLFSFSPPEHCERLPLISQSSAAAKNAYDAKQPMGVSYQGYRHPSSEVMVLIDRDTNEIVAEYDHDLSAGSKDQFRHLEASDIGEGTRECARADFPKSTQRFLLTLTVEVGDTHQCTRAEAFAQCVNCTNVLKERGHRLCSLQTSHFSNEFALVDAYDNMFGLETPGSYSNRFGDISFSRI